MPGIDQLTTTEQFERFSERYKEETPGIATQIDVLRGEVARGEVDPHHATDVLGYMVAAEVIFTDTAPAVSDYVQSQTTN